MNGSVEVIISNGHHRYEMNNGDVAQFVEDKFQRAVVVVKELYSFEDINILVESVVLVPPPVPSASNATQSQQKFVLKILSQEDISETEYGKKIECVKCLKSKGFSCSEFIPGVDGNYIQSFDKNKDSDMRCALLYTFVEGKELEHTGYVHHPILIFELGSFLAHFHQALKDIACREDLVPDPDDPWYLHNYNKLLANSYTELIKDKSKNRMLCSIMECAGKILDDSKNALHKDILHGDFHGMNIIVPEMYNPSLRSLCLMSRQRKHNMNEQSLQLDERDQTHLSEQSGPLISLVEEMKRLRITTDSSSPLDLLDVYGVIDFSEISYSYTSLEVGRVIGDVMATFLVHLAAMAGCEKSPSSRGRSDNLNIIAELSESSEDHLVKIGGYIIAGYLSVNGTLTPTDIKCIYPGMMMSLCQYYLLGIKAAIDQPDAKDYVSYCSKEAAMLLEYFHQMDNEVISQTWHTAATEILGLS